MKVSKSRLLDDLNGLELGIIFSIILLISLAFYSSCIYYGVVSFNAYNIVSYLVGLGIITLLFVLFCNYSSISDSYFTRYPYRTLTNFCDRNHVKMSTKVKMDIEHMCRNNVLIYRCLVYDLAKYKTFDRLFNSNYNSPNWLIWFIYVSNGSMVALAESDMKSVSINYLSDLVNAYELYKVKYGIADALNRFNADYWLDLNADELNTISHIVSYYLKYENIDRNCKVDSMIKPY